MDYHGIILHDYRVNTRLGVLITVELEVFPWQQKLRQTVTADKLNRNFQGGVCYHSHLTDITRSQQRTEMTEKE
jgi:hypothetical protein